MNARSVLIGRISGGVSLAALLLLAVYSRVHLSRHTGVEVDSLHADESVEVVPARLAERVAELERLVTEAQQQQTHGLGGYSSAQRQTSYAEGTTKDILPYAQTNYAASTGTSQQTIDDIPAGSLVWVTITYGVFQDLMLNWVAHLQQLQVPYVVFTFDDESAAACRSNGVTHVQHAVAPPPDVARNGTDKMKWFFWANGQKPRIVADLLRRRRWAAVVLSDVDAVWLRSPSDLMAAHPTAEIIVSTDCLSHEVEAKLDLRDPHPPEYFACGHLPGTLVDWTQGAGGGFNSGIIIFRSCPAALATLRAWGKAMQAAEGGTELRSEQAALNQLLTDFGEARVVQSTVYDPRVIWAAKSSVRVLPAPALLFANGHVAFMQHLPERHGVAPHVIHVTFIQGDHSAKAARLREAGLWLRDPDTHYTADIGYLSYENTVDQFINWVSALAAGKGQEMVWGRKHLLAAAYQLAVLRDAFGMAEALNRTLVLPHFRCYCDQDWAGEVVRDCKFPFSDVELPFACPADLFINNAADVMEAAGFPHHGPAFLADPKIPFAVRHSRQVAAVLLPSGVTLRANQSGLQADAPTLSLSLLSAVPHGADAPALRAALGVSQARVTHLIDMTPGAFGGFGDPAVDDAFDARFASIATQSWCCSGNEAGTAYEDDHMIKWRYRLPRPLRDACRPSDTGLDPPYPPASGSDLTRLGAFGITEQQRPAFCDTLPKPLMDYAQGPNHPCNYLPRG